MACGTVQQHRPYRGGKCLIEGGREGTSEKWRTFSEKEHQVKEDQENKGVRARVGCNESVMLKFNQVQGSPLGVTPSGIGKKCHCKQEVPYCVPVTKHFHYKNGQLGNQESVSVTSVTVSGEP